MVSFWFWGNGRFCFLSDLKLPRLYNGWHDQDTHSDHFFLCSPPPASFVQNYIRSIHEVFFFQSYTIPKKFTKAELIFQKIMPAGNRMETEAFSS